MFSLNISYLNAIKRLRYIIFFYSLLKTSANVLRLSLDEFATTNN